MEEKWITKAFDYFSSGKRKLYFCTNSGIGVASRLPIKNIYFKTKGKKEITVKADFLELVQENPVSYRLSGSEKRIGKYYYGYKNLRWLKNKLEITNLKYLKSEKNLRLDIPGASIIIDPKVE